MKVRCAWCLKEGKPEAESLIGEREPVGDATETHGICPNHRKQVEGEIAEHRRKIKELQEEQRRVQEKHQRAMKGLQDAAKELEEKVDP